MADEYTTHNVFLKSADFSILVIEFPEEDVNDKLTLLSGNKGLIYKHYYEDFAIGTCVANAGPFFYHVRKRPELLTKFSEIRKEVLQAVFLKSPGFCPENIVINQNNILKTKGTARKDEKVRPLVENDFWNQDPSPADLGPATITSGPSKSSDDSPFSLGDDTDLPYDELPENPFAEPPGSGDINVPYVVVGHKWDRLGLHINVREYEESEDAQISLLGGTPFDTSRGYHLLIIERCIEDFADIFQLLDNMGVSSRTDPSVLAEELYEIAIEHNPFLKLEDIDLKAVRRAYREQEKDKNGSSFPRTAAAGASEAKGLGLKKKKRFADIPKEKLLNLDKEIKKKIIGQDAAVATLVEAVQCASVGLKREHEPVGVFLFTGKTGVGKTETAKVLADVLGAHLARIDCQDFQQPHEAVRLTGSPPGYIGYEDGGVLTKEVAKHPFSVVLFDEIEKAHSNLYERLLNVLDDGFLTDNKGRKVSFKNCILILTSNVGVKEISAIGKTVGFGDAHNTTATKSSKAREQALRKKFKPEFLNRVDEIIHFRDLEKEDFLSILDVLLDEVKSQIKAREITLHFNVGAKNFLLDKGIDKKFGARPLERIITKQLKNPLARAILMEEVKDKSKVNVALKPDKGGLAFRTVKRAKEG